MKLDLVFPCNEDKNKMADTQDGKFCGQCNKEVIDFTTWEKDDILAYLKNRKSCGIFKKGQLDMIKSKPVEKVVSPSQRMFNKMAASVALLAVALFGCGDKDAQAQQPEKPKETKPTENCQPQIMGKIAVKKIETIDTNHVKIGEAIPQDELLMGDTNLDPPVQEEPPLMGVPVIMPAENQILERGEAVIRDEE